MADKIGIEISGHKAWIGHITPQIAGGTLVPWDDRLCVFLSFDEAVDSILGFYVYLPVKVYGKETFLKLVKEEGEKELAIHLRQTRKARAEREEEAKKEKALERIAGRVRAVIGLTNSL